MKIIYCQRRKLKYLDIRLCFMSTARLSQYLAISVCKHSNVYFDWLRLGKEVFQVWDLLLRYKWPLFCILIASLNFLTYTQVYTLNECRVLISHNKLYLELFVNHNWIVLVEIVQLLTEGNSFHKFSRNMTSTIQF